MRFAKARQPPPATAPHVRLDAIDIDARGVATQTDPERLTALADLNAEDMTFLRRDLDPVEA